MAGREEGILDSLLEVVWQRPVTAVIGEAIVMIRTLSVMLVAFLFFAARTRIDDTGDGLVRLSA